MGNFCTNCGAKLQKEDNFCTNCGTKIDKHDINPNNRSKSSLNSIEINEAKKELKRVIGGNLCYNKNFTKNLHEEGLDIFRTGNAIRKQVEKEIYSGQIKTASVELRVNQLIHEYKIKNEEAKRKKEEMVKQERKKQELERKKREQEREKQELERKKREEERKKQELERKRQEEEYIRQYGGGYCSSSCRHHYEEYFDSRGGIVGDIDNEGYVEYYCDLGHTLSYGRYCKDYE